MFFIGIDDGNFDTKSQNTISSNGFCQYSVLPAMVKTYLYYNGTYYVSSNERFNYREDKTLDNRALILALFGIGKEIIYQLERNKVAPENMQEEISKITEIALGIGLPPLQWHTAEKKVNFFKKYMGKHIEFDYAGYHFAFSMPYCDIFPQAIAALLTNAKDEVIANSPKYVGVDIGGGTIEVIPVNKGVPDGNHCPSDKIGIIFLFQSIQEAIKREYNIDLEYDDIEAAIKKQRTLLDDDVVKRIWTLTQNYVDSNVIDMLVQRKVNFDTTVVIFLGGGSLLLKPFIKKNKQIKHIHFLKDPVKANAKGYAIMMKKKYGDNK